MRGWRTIGIWRAAGNIAIDAKLRTRFVAVAAVTIGAMLAIVAMIVVHGAWSERAGQEARAQLLARSSAMIIDREMSRLEALLTGLATSPALKSGDLEFFHRQAVAMPKPEGCGILLFDPEMKHRANAQWPWGTELPVAAERSQDEMRKALLHSRFSNLIYAPNQRRYVASIIMAVEVSGEAGWLLAATVPAETVGQVIGELDLPPGWVAGIFDREGVTIDRVPAKPELVAQPAGPELRAAIAASREGTLEVVTRDGIAVFTAFSRSGISGWTAAVGIPLSQLQAPMRRAVELLVIGGGVILIVGVGITALLGRRLARPVAEQLRLSDERFRNVADSAPVLIWMSGPDKGCVYFNEPWLAFTGRALEEELGNGWTEGVHPEDLQRCLETYTSHCDRHLPFRMEYRLRRADGEYRWIEDSGIPQLGWNRAFFGYVGSCIDVTERKLAEQIVRESEQRFRVMAETVPALLFTAGPTGRFDYANSRYHAYVGTTHGSVSNTDWLSRVHPDDAIHVLSEWTTCIESGSPFSSELRLRGVDGAYRWFAARAQPVLDNDGAVVRWVGSALDVHDLKGALISLEEIAARLVNVEAEERRRIARELHDSTAQVLVAASLDAARLRNLPTLRDGKGAEIMTDLITLIDQALQEVRTLSYLFHPPILEGQALRTALRSYVRGFAKRSGIAVSVEFQQEASVMSQTVETTLFRIAQEALANVHRHSGSTKAHVRLRQNEQSVVLEIGDEGGGIGRSGPDSGEAELGVGIIGMKTRVERLGGRLEIETSESGTTVRATLGIGGQSITADDLGAHRARPEALVQRDTDSPVGILI
jgi:PAS domain S-box-containing protein